MKRSLGERTEFVEDLLFHELDTQRKDVLDWLVSPSDSSRVSERHEQVPSDIHVHVRFDFSCGNTVDDEFCLLVKHDGRLDDADLLRRATFAERDAITATSRPCEMYGLVLVVVREGIDDGEGMIWRVIPSVTRLKRVDDRVRSRVNACEFSGALCTPTAAAIDAPKDREIVLSAQTLPEVIKRAPDVMNAVSDHETDFHRRDIEWLERHPKGVLLGIYLGRQSGTVTTCLQVGCDMAVNGVKVSLCPPDLCDGAEKRR